MKSFLQNMVMSYAVRDLAWPALPLIVADIATGEILYASQPACLIFGYERHEVEGQQVEMLVPESLREQHRKYRHDTSIPKTRVMGVGRQLWGQRKDGTLFPVNVGLTAVQLGEKTLGIASVIDLTGVFGPPGHGQGQSQTGETEPIDPLGLSLGSTRNPTVSAPPPSGDAIPTKPGEKPSEKE